MKRALSLAGRLLALMALALLALQLYFAGRVAMMRWVDPHSTSYERAEMVRLAVEQHQILWSQDWRPYAQISAHLKRAVIASEDAGFTDHNGVEWDAIEKAWERNQAAEAAAAKRNEAALRRAQKAGTAGTSAAPPPRLVTPKIMGGSTITQQLAKNLFLSGERTIWRKGQEMVITFMLEALLPKERILEIYLNHVEWGEGVFGAQAAAKHYFGVDASALSAGQAARLAVMLPAPKRFEKRPGSPYVAGRAGTVLARMGAVELP